jgi:hypothetical protein
MAGITALKRNMISDVPTAISAGMPMSGSRIIEAVSRNPRPLYVIGMMSADNINEIMIATEKKDRLVCMKN